MRFTALTGRAAIVGSAALLLVACQHAPQKAPGASIEKQVSASRVLPEPQAQQPFALNQVTLNESPFKHAQQVNLGYLLALDADRLLAPYLREAGLPPKAENYGNWESSGLDGHIGGHYVSALSLAWAATGDSAIGQRLDYTLAELKRAQQQTGGYLGGIPDSDAFWEQIAAGNIDADLFSLNERWVPLYNIDKIFNGLRDAYVIGERNEAKQMLRELGEWMLSITDGLTGAQIQRMLYSEHGGLNAVFADMAQLFDDERYLRLARAFTHKQIIKPLTKGKDQLTGLHANTQIPKIIGALKVAQAEDDETWQRAARFFWQTVSQQRSVSIGGNSVREHFHDKDDFSAMIEDVEGPETCNTYNMLKLSKLLFLRTGDPRYIAFYERATYNHILSSQHPQHGGLVYFTPMRPGHYRMYSSVQDSMWCCVGSGIENHSKYGELVFTHDVDNLWVNLFISSSLKWEERGIALDLQTRFPDDDEVRLTVTEHKSDQSGSFTLHVRQPDWLQTEMQIQVNGKKAKATLQNGYLSITRDWQKGDTVSFALDANPYTEQLPDGQDYYSVLYGPVVLATKVTAFEDEQLRFIADDSRMGHIAAGPVCPPEALPVMLGDPARFISDLNRVPGEDLRFVARDHVAQGNAGDNPIEQTAPVTLIPFFRLHDARYQVYWPQMQPADFSTFVADAKAESSAREALARQTVDAVTPGQQQPEVEHDFAGNKTRAGVNNNRHWRDASDWFSYTLSNPEERADTLRLTFFEGDSGRDFEVLINDIHIASVSLPVGTPDEAFYSVDYPLPESLRNVKRLRLTFKATEDSVAGGIYGVRLLATE